MKRHIQEKLCPRKEAAEEQEPSRAQPSQAQRPQPVLFPFPSSQSLHSPRFGAVFCTGVAVTAHGSAAELRFPSRGMDAVLSTTVQVTELNLFSDFLP